MIDINDNDYKLLKMNESLLSKLDRDSEEFKRALDTYKELAIKIDKVNYNNFIDQINNYDYNQSLQDRLCSLEQLVSSYEQLNELQYRFRSVYEIYANDEFKLSDLGVILIDTIREQINLISGYLLNIDNIDSSKKKLSKYNEQLIALDKNEEMNCEVYQRFENELRNSLTYSNIKLEYQENEFDLIKLLEDSNFLKEILFREESSVKDQEEMLDTAIICYNKMPSSNNEEIVNSLKMDSIRAKYRLVLIRIVKLIYRNEDSYSELVKKREELLRLLEERKSYLKDMDIKYVVDPFNRIRVEEQLRYLRLSISDGTKEIIDIRKNINELSNKLDEFLNKNGEFLKEINAMSNSFVKDNTSLGDLTISSTSDIRESLVSDNQVIGIREIADGVNVSRMHEKANGVIKRVYEMISVSTYSPELELVSDKKDIDNDLFQEVDTPFKSARFFNDRASEGEIFKDINNIDLFEPTGVENVKDDNTIVNNIDVITMPDAFWEVKDDEDKDEVIDEQIKKLKLVS